ncbi:MAG: tetratricopeptide repeat protein [Sphingobacteriaceae bacterium]
MKMKPLLIALSLIGISFSAVAQKAELNSAKGNYDKFITLKDAGSLALALPSINSAKASIDRAAVNEKTAIDPTTWTYKALIYADLAILDTVSVSAEQTLATAKEDLKKAIELGATAQNATNIERANNLFAQFELNKGVKAFQTQKFSQAYDAFEKSLSYKPSDTTLTYYAGLSAINAQNYKAAIKKYADLVKLEYSANKLIALDLSKLYALEKDTVNAIAVASTYASKFNDQALATQEIELSLMSGKQKQVISRITEQIAKDPTNKLEYFYLGIAYDALKDYKKAEEAYKKALELDPKYVDACLNLGSGILNNGIDLYNKANTLPVNKQKEYDAAMKAANAEFDRAFPYLQQSVQLDPKNLNALQNLKTYYVIKKNQAKVAELTKQINALQ